MRFGWIAVALLSIASPLSAQPFGQVLRLQGYPQHGYIEVPADTQLDTPAMTVEGWVSVRDAHGGGCSSIAGNGYVTGWWLGICGTTMRSYFNGSPSLKDGGVIPDVPDSWIHIAAVTDGTTRRHYINGNLVLETAETTPRSVSIKPVRIGSDPDYDFMPQGKIDELRIWTVARTQAQIRRTMSVHWSREAYDVAEFQGLEAWYRFEGDAMDSRHSHHGTISGTGTAIEGTPEQTAAPFGQFLRLQGYPQHGYIEAPADTLLDTPAMTVEAWVSVRDPRSGACSSITGNGYITGWWLGVCGTTMRSYFNGVSSVKSGGVIPDAPASWIHIAAVTDGTTRRHYINGNLAFESAETAPRSVSTKPLRIGSDPDWDYMAQGRIDELRIWRVARTQDQIRQTMFAPWAPEVYDVTGQYQGLEAWYRFEGNAMDVWRTHHGTIFGTGTGFEGTTPLARHRGAAH